MGLRIHLTGASHSPDLWYPYLWMLGGDIVSMRQGHPTKGNYWYPSFNSTEGVKDSRFRKESDRCWNFASEGSLLGGRVPRQEICSND